MRLVAKISGLLFLTGSATAAYFLSPNFINSNSKDSRGKQKKPSENIVPVWQQTLAKEGYTLVSENDNWQLFPGLSEAYSEESKLSLKDAENKLSEMCNKFRKQEQLSEEEQKEAKRWCVQPRTLDSLLQQKGKKLLYEIKGDDYSWDRVKTRKKVEEYAQNSNEKLKMEISWKDSNKLTINPSFSESDVDRFQEACLNLLGAKNFDKDLTEKMEKAEKWCVE